MIKEYFKKIDLPCPTANMNSLEKKEIKGWKSHRLQKTWKETEVLALVAFIWKE